MLSSWTSYISCGPLSSSNAPYLTELESTSLCDWFPWLLSFPTLISFSWFRKLVFIVFHLFLTFYHFPSFYCFLPFPWFSLHSCFLPVFLCMTTHKDHLISYAPLCVQLITNKYNFTYFWLISIILTYISLWYDLMLSDLLLDREMERRRLVGIDRVWVFSRL